MALAERTGRFLGFTHSATVEGAATEVLRIPPLDSGAQISVTAIPGANTALVESTTSTDAKVIAGTAVWVAWPQGSVTVTTQDVITSPVTGIRFSATGGQCSFEVVI